MKYTFTLLIIFFITSCSTLSTQITTKRLLGVWELQDYGYGPYQFTQFALLEDGRKCVLSFEIGEEGNRVDAYVSNWAVKNNMLVTTFGHNTTGIEYGYVMHDRIDYLTTSKLELFMVKPQGRRTEVHRKLKEVQPDRLCVLAQSIIDFKKSKTLRRFK